ncbi:uncharacterized protein [Salminus brasiliensis]|uniref:uncharacterized protein n=1 Tax=Salminus brasiliensis TaxID=930266 RepID=UPI003B8390DF
MWTLSCSLKALPVISQSGNGTPKEGDSVNLTCAVNCSHSSPQFGWFKDSEHLPTSGSVLHLPALTVEDSGNYSCALKTDKTVRSETLSINVEGGWDVNYPGPICAVRGLNVIISCNYFYPKPFKVQTVLWCSMKSADAHSLNPPYVYNSRSPNSSDIFQYAGDKQSNCTLSIRNVQFSHSAEYRFRFLTNKYDGKWTGDPGVTLEVGVLMCLGQSPVFTVHLEEDDSVVYSAVAGK